MTKWPPQARMRVGSVCLAPLQSLRDPRAVCHVLLERSKACPGKCDAICALKAHTVRQCPAAKPTVNCAQQELLPLSLVRRLVLLVLLVLSANRARLSAASARQDLIAPSWA